MWYYQKAVYNAQSNYFTIFILPIRLLFWLITDLKRVQRSRPAELARFVKISKFFNIEILEILK